MLPDQRPRACQSGAPKREGRAPASEKTTPAPSLFYYNILVSLHSLYKSNSQGARTPTSIRPPVLCFGAAHHLSLDHLSLSPALDASFPFDWDLSRRHSRDILVHRLVLVRIKSPRYLTTAIVSCRSLSGEAAVFALRCDDPRADCSSYRPQHLRRHFTYIIPLHWSCPASPRFFPSAPSLPPLLFAQQQRIHRTSPSPAFAAPSRPRSH